LTNPLGRRPVSADESAPRQRAAPNRRRCSSTERRAIGHVLGFERLPKKTVQKRVVVE
jgi:hypothetical protein